MDSSEKIDIVSEEKKQTRRHHHHSHHHDDEKHSHHHDEEGHSHHHGSSSHHSNGKKQNLKAKQIRTYFGRIFILFFLLFLIFLIVWAVLNPSYYIFDGKESNEQRIEEKNSRDEAYEQEYGKQNE